MHTWQMLSGRSLQEERLPTLLELRASKAQVTDFEIVQQGEQHTPHRGMDGLAPPLPPLPPATCHNSIS